MAEALRMLVREYLEYLKRDKRSPTNTLLAYSRDLTQWTEHFEAVGIHELSGLKAEDVRSFLAQAQGEKGAAEPATLRRKLAALRGFASFLTDRGKLPKGA